ncbi:hypothetical protein TURU_015347 [Turdus rufiventris]|nr:hypothetical protein TURU_015347 [Turdus rufiventris]
MDSSPLWRRGFALESRRSTDPAASPRNHLWTLSPRSVTVRAKNHHNFGEIVGYRALQQGDWNLLERLGMPRGGVLRVEESVQVHPTEFRSVPEGPLPPASGVDPQDVEGHQAFPVFKAVPSLGRPNRHDPTAWCVVQDLQDKVARYGLGSTQVMQIIRVLLNTDLSPYDVRHIAQVLFQPVQFKVFEDNWRHIADKAAAENMLHPQDDPRYAVGSDVLMGQHGFSSPDLQDTWDPLVLEQCQKIGFAATVKTIEAAAPRPKYVKITQGPREPFLQFVEKIAAALEKQVEDDTPRQLLCKQLARDNANVDCFKIIQSLPGDPSLTHMVQACANVGTIDHETSTLAAAIWHQQNVSGG